MRNLSGYGQQRRLPFNFNSYLLGILTPMILAITGGGIYLFGRITTPTQNQPQPAVVSPAVPSNSHRLISSPATIAGSGNASAAQTAVPSVSPIPLSQPAGGESGRVFLEGNRISFVPPPGFAPMPRQEIAIKFPRGNPPRYVYANDRGNVAIAITLSNAPVSPSQLSQAMQPLSAMLEKALPGLRWVDRGMVTISNQQWLKLEAITKALDTDIHNQMYFTSFDDKLLGFNFNATVQRYPEFQTALHQSRDSIQIR